MESPGSPLSDLSSEEFQETRYLSASPYPEGPRPSKRQRLNGGAASRPSAPFDAASIHDEPLGVVSDVDISSDTDGSVPGSPHPNALGIDDEDGGGPGGKEQVSACKWDGCDAGEQGNMDLLVKHLHKEHIHARQKKYSCEWGDCSRKGIPHASGYALRAHMRSHTREKPFYCTLPECDRSFTRSDALAKHMRTVHETEALRPSDPVPKHHSSNPQNKSQRLRLTFNKFSGGANSADVEPVPVKLQSPAPSLTQADIEYETNNPTFTLDPETHKWVPQFPPDVIFTPEQLAIPAEHLYRLMKCHVEWASEEAEELKIEALAAEKARKAEWMAKDLALQDLIRKHTKPEFDHPEPVGRHSYGPPKDGYSDVLGAPSTHTPLKSYEEPERTVEQEVGDILSGMATGAAR